jgi:hypothetical protein
MAFLRFGAVFNRRVIGHGTFEFRYFHLDQELYSSLWYLEFYGQFGFLGMTGLPDATNIPPEATS